EIVLRVKPRGPRWHTPEYELPTLSKVAEPLAERGLRRLYARAWEREAEVAAVVRKLGEEKVNLVLVGEPGSGKTTVLAQAVQALERQGAEKKDGPRAHRYWLTSGSRLIAGMKSLGQWEERCEIIIEELASVGGVLCVADLLDLVRTGGRSPTASIASFFLPY